MTSPFADPLANPLAQRPLHSRTDVQRAVLHLYEPLLAHQSVLGARVRLGSYQAAFAPRVAELEGFARPLYGIVPLTVGGGEFPHWSRLVSGLIAGTDPASPEYWGPVGASPDQRMVEQAAIGLALAFCPEQLWEPLDAAERARLVAWLRGIFEFDPVPNNWQFFRVLVALGLQRVGVAFDERALHASLATLESYRVGTHWYVDGGLGTVDYYIPFAFHTYGLIYAAANRLGLGDDAQAECYRERAALFAGDFQHWFAPDGAAVPFGRSLTYRFAMSSFWGALAWADVEALPWGRVNGMAMRNLRWWVTKTLRTLFSSSEIDSTKNTREAEADSRNWPADTWETSWRCSNRCWYSAICRLAQGATLKLSPATSTTNGSANDSTGRTKCSKLRPLANQITISESR